MKPPKGFIGHAKPTQATLPEIGRARIRTAGAVWFVLQFHVVLGSERPSTGGIKKYWRRETRTIHTRGFLLHPRSRHHSVSRGAAGSGSRCRRSSSTSARRSLTQRSSSGFWATCTMYRVVKCAQRAWARGACVCVSARCGIFARL